MKKIVVKYKGGTLDGKVIEGESKDGICYNTAKSSGIAFIDWAELQNSILSGKATSATITSAEV